MRIAIRTDASPTIGAGHLRRCLTLAEALRKRGAELRFLLTPGVGDGSDSVKKAGFAVDPITPSDVLDDANEMVAQLGGWNADRIVVDRYRLGPLWEERVRPVTKRLIVIDDLADTPHQCDLLLDQNFYPDPAQRYEGLIPPDATRLFGPAYALIDPAYAAARRPDRPAKVEGPYRIVVSFGGGDDRGAAAKTMTALALLKREDITVDLIVGGANPRRQEIETVAAPLPFVNVIGKVDNMISLLADADLAIGAGGVSTWERFCLGVPTVALTIAPVQKPHLKELAAAGFLQWEGEANQIAPRALSDAVNELLASPATRQRMRERSMGLVDGGGAERVAKAILDA